MPSGAQVGLNYFFIFLDFGWRAFGNLFAVIEHCDAIAQAHHQLHIVLNEQNGAIVFADLVDQLSQLNFFLWRSYQQRAHLAQ